MVRAGECCGHVTLARRIMRKLTPNLIVQNINASIEFYKNVLGFETIMTVPEEEPFQWAMMKNDNVEIMFQSKESLPDLPKEIAEMKKGEIGASLILYIDVPDIKTLYKKVKGQVSIVEDMHTTFYGTQEFAIKDVDGYILTFAQDNSHHN